MSHYDQASRMSSSCLHLHDLRKSFWLFGAAERLSRQRQSVYTSKTAIAACMSRIRKGELFEGLGITCLEVVYRQLV